MYVYQHNYELYSLSFVFNKKINITFWIEESL